MASDWIYGQFKLWGLGSKLGCYIITLWIFYFFWITKSGVLVNKLAHRFFAYNISSWAGDRLAEFFDLSPAEWAKAKLVLSLTDFGT